MEDKPSVLFMSCADLDPTDIIKLVLDSNDLSDSIRIEENIEAYPWHIDNKYYSTDVQLCSVHTKTIGNQKFADSVEAVVLHFDSSVRSGLDNAVSWLPFLNEYAPEIKILLCKNCPEEGECNKRSVQEWCVEKGFELVELEPIVDSDDNEEEDDFPETTGVKRIIQALNAHVWPNLVMKNEDPTRPAQNNENRTNVNMLRNELLLEESLDELLENDDDFSQLFSQLPEVKARVSALSGDERKAAAEQVVKAFWKAMGGDDDELFDV